jgi:hypothetical protein
MEIFLNLAWAMLAALSVLFWLHRGPRQGTKLRTQLAALGLLLLILFPVISVSDDLQMAFNLAEDDIYLRRDPTADHSFTVHLPTAILPAFLHADVTFGFSELDVSSQAVALSVQNPATSRILNRPPPSA